jgi:hypothetical protein
MTGPIRRIFADPKAGGARIPVEPSLPRGDVPCPNCGTLVWIGERRQEKETGPYDESRLARQEGETPVWLRKFFESIERSMTQWIAEGVHSRNIELIKASIAQFDQELEKIESEHPNPIPADAKARIFEKIEQLKTMLRWDTENSRIRLRAEQRRNPPPAPLATRNQTRDPVLDRSYAAGLPARQMPPRPSTAARLIHWIRTMVQGHAQMNPASSYGDVYDRWLDG